MNQGDGHDGRFAALCAVYFLSGFCSLVYQTVWIAQFSLIFGSTVFAVSCVVGVFFGGLALGSALFGGRASRLANPVRTYAILELAIGVYALAFPWLLSLAESAYGGVYARAAGSLAGLTLARSLTALSVLLLPTVLMGGTLPVLLQHLVRRLEMTEKRAGLVYGLNAVGAAAGSLLAGYLLIRVMGVADTNAAVGLLNIAIGLLALGLGRDRAVAATAPDSPAASTAAEQQVPSGATLTVACFALSGFVSLSYEVIWLRHLSFFFRDTIYLYTAIITLFVLGIGLGSLVFGFLRRPWRMALLGLLQLGIGLTTLAGLYLPVLWHRSIFSLGEDSPGMMLGILFVILLPPTLLMGGTFPVVSGIVTTQVRGVGHSIGRAYALNVAGSIAGTLAAGFFFFAVAGLQATLYLLFGANMLMAAALMLKDVSFPWRRAGWVPVALAVLFPLAVESSASGRLPHALLARNAAPGAQILAVREGVTGTSWATTSPEDGIRLLENNVAIGRSRDGFFHTQGFIPMLIAPRIPRRYLGLAFGAGLSSYAARLFPEVEALDFVDISRTNIDVALDVFPENRGLRDDPRVTFIIDDAYNHLKYSRASYDLVFVETTPPMFSFRNAALYSRDFLALGRERLAPGGMWGQVVPLGNLSPEETRSVMATFASVFPECLLWWNHTDAVMIGATAPLALDAQAIWSRLERPAIREALERHAPATYYSRIGGFLSGFLLDDAAFRRLSAGGDIYTNDQLGLKFSTGEQVTPANIEALHSALTPWPDLATRLRGFETVGLDVQMLASRRERLMALTYQRYPALFYGVFRDYVSRHSAAPLRDLETLRRFLLERGMMVEAAEVTGELQKLRRAR